MAANLLLFLYFLECTDIPESTLRRRASAKKIWGCNGELTEVSAKKVGLRTELITFLQDQLSFYRAIEKLLAISLIRHCNSENRGRIFSVHPLVQYLASQRAPQVKRQRWQRQAALLVCHAFPYSTYSDKRQVFLLLNISFLRYRKLIS